ncbi:MAG TPA: hypothetical protein VK914_07720 [bacterium]|jgi:hypothetical protein|nr:hypothetical protein [bacterium]
MKPGTPQWILLTRRPNLRLTNTKIFRSLKNAVVRLRLGKSLGLIIDASFRDKSGDAWAIAYGARELFPNLAISILSVFPDQEKPAISQHLKQD